MTREGLERAVGEIEEGVRGLGGAAGGEDSTGGSEGRGHATPNTGGDLIAHEICWAARLARLGAELGLARLEPAAKGAPAIAAHSLPARTRVQLVEALGPLLEQHATAWGARLRPGGRRDSLARLQRLDRALKET
jgi:hypothetical protein